jgi:hypothetical protein
MKTIFKFKKMLLIFLLMATRLFAVHFLDNANGTVNDRQTGLVWQKCSMGQNNDTTCSGTASAVSWTNALAYCNALTTIPARIWRLPNINELKSIVDRTIGPNPAALNNTVFPATGVTFNYWSSSTYVPNTMNAWYVPFYDGIINYNGKIVAGYVRCVSTGP